MPFQHKAVLILFMKKTNKFLVIITIILIALAGLVWWQFGNIKSVYYSFKYSNGQIDGLIDEHYNDIDTYISDKDNLNVRQSTEVEEKLHKEEIIDDKEFQDVLTGKNDVPTMFGMDISLNEDKNFTDSAGNTVTKDELLDAKEENAGNQPEPADDPKTSEADKKASESIAKMYVLKSTFESKLEALFNEAKNHYKSLTKEQRKESKAELAAKYYSKATALEASCDAQVDTVLKDLEQALKASGESTELVTKIRTAYNEEKSLKKAYYLNKYK